MGPREQRQREQRALRLAKSQRPEVIKRFNRKFGKVTEVGQRSRQFEASRRERVIRLYRAKLPIAVIAERLGVSQAYVSTVARQEGINRKPQGPLRRSSGRV